MANHPYCPYCGMLSDEPAPGCTVEAQHSALHIAKARTATPEREEPRLLHLGGGWIGPGELLELGGDLCVHLFKPTVVKLPVRFPSWIMVTRLSLGNELFAYAGEACVPTYDAAVTSRGFPLEALRDLELPHRKMQIGERFSVTVANFGKKPRFVSLAVFGRATIR